MFIEKNHRVKIEDAEKGCFLRVTLKGKQTEIGRPKASRAVCIYRCNACFTDAIALDSFDCIPSKTLFAVPVRSQAGKGKYFSMQKEKRTGRTKAILCAQPILFPGKMSMN